MYKKREHVERRSNAEAAMDWPLKKENKKDDFAKENMDKKGTEVEKEEKKR